MTFTQYSMAVNTAKLCCHWFKILQKDVITMVMTCTNAPEGNQMVLT